MTTITPDDDFKQEITCSYKDEQYSVRDNGAVLRHSRENGKVRPTDNHWTFGKPNEKTGYMEIASARVHRIVAMAFHGEPPTPEHVVDHIDTNKRNNRPENLRWVTRLENVLLNTTTAARITRVCGSVEAFLADPAKFRDKFPEPNYEWMCTVNSKEAQMTLNRLESWAKKDNLPSVGNLGDWIIGRDTLPEAEEFVVSITPNAVQRNWRFPSEFPCCPQEYSDEPLKSYYDNLKPDYIFCRNDVYSSIVLKSAMSVDKQSIYIMTKPPVGKNTGKPWSLAEITFENGKFVHTSLGSFFSEEGAEKRFCLAQGLEWEGADSIDDYC
jgi:hypothetical protein